MIRFLLQAAIRFLIGPGGRMLFIVGVVIAAWIWWVSAPLKPLASWTLSAYESALAECSRDASTLVTVASSTRRAPYGGIPESILDGPIRIWDLPAGRERVNIPVSGPPLRFVRLAPDCSWLLTINEMWAVKLWDPVTGRLRAELNPPVGVPTSANSLPWFRLSDDSQLIAVHDSATNVIRVWEGLTGRLVTQIAGARPPFALSSNSHRLLAIVPAIGGGPNTVAGLWDIATGQQLHILPGHRHSICAVAISPDGRLLATGLYPGPPRPSPGQAEVKLWNAATGQLLADIEVGGSRNFLHTLAFSPDNSLLIVRGWGTSLLWDVTEMPPRNRDDLIAATFNVEKGIPTFDSNRGPHYAPDRSRSYVIGSAGRIVSVSDEPMGNPRYLAIPRLFGVGACPMDYRTPTFGPGGRTLAVPVVAEIPNYAPGPKGVLDRILRHSNGALRWSTVVAFDPGTGRNLGSLPSLLGDYTILGFAADGASFWTERSIRGDDYIQVGDTRIFEQWPVPSPETPWWLLAVTSIGVIFIATGLWRFRRRRSVVGPCGGTP